MYEQLRQEAADRDGMITKEDKAPGKSCRHRTNEAQVVRVQQVDRSTPGSGHSVQIGSIDDDCWPALTSTTAAGEGSETESLLVAR
jgi:hypothetical protein